MRSKLEGLHPGLYRYHSKASFDQSFDSVYALLQQDMSIMAFRDLVLPLFVKIGCGHTFMSMPGAYYQQRSRSRFLPLQLGVISKKLYVVKNLHPTLGLPPGAEVTAINKQDSKTILDFMLARVPSDGYNQTLKFKIIERDFIRIYWDLISRPDTFRLTYIDPADQQQKSFSLPALPQHELLKPAQVPQAPLLMEILEDPKVALITIRRTGKTRAFRRFLQSSVQKIQQQGITQVIIDMRHDGVSLDTHVGLLYSYLASAPFKVYESFEVTRRFKKQLPFLLRPVFSLFITETDTGNYRWNYHKRKGLQEPVKNPYAGQLYVLINGNTFSASAEFATIAHANKRAVFVGEETGGAYYGNNSVFVPPGFKLPNTGISALVGGMKYVMPVTGYPYAGRGLLPDFLVEPTIADVLQERDPQKEFVLRKIKQEEQKE